MAQQPPQQTQPNGATIMVGNRLPSGITLHIGEGREKQTFTLPGTATYALPNPDRKFEAPDLHSGATLTPVPREFWECWLKDHKDFAPYAAGQIFAANSANDANAQARERQSEPTGIDRIDPKRPGHSLQAVAEER